MDRLSIKYKYSFLPEVLKIEVIFMQKLLERRNNSLGRWKAFIFPFLDWNFSGKLKVLLQVVG